MISVKNMSLNKNAELMSFLEVELIDQEKIKMGFDSIYMTEEGFFLKKSLSGKTTKEVKHYNIKKEYKKINVDSDLLKLFLIDKKERFVRMSKYNENATKVIDFLSNK